MSTEGGFSPNRRQQSPRHGRSRPEARDAQKRLAKCIVIVLGVGHGKSLVELLGAHLDKLAVILALVPRLGYQLPLPGLKTLTQGRYYRSSSSVWCTC